MAMAEEQKTKQVIEIITYPEGGRMELEKMANSMLAIKRDYHRWLDEQELSPKNDPSLKLYVEKVEEGSIKLWLAKFMESGIPLIEYGVDFFQKIKSPQKDAAKWSHNELQSKHAFLKNNIGNKIEASILKLDERGKTTIINYGNFINNGPVILPPDRIKSNEKWISNLLEKQKQLYKDTPIRFTQYHVKKNAKIIAPEIDSYSDYTALLSKPARTLLNAERKNIFKKRYAANIVVCRISGSNKIHSYVIKKITAS